MQSILPHDIFNNTFIVTAARTIFWEAQQILILSDLHLGKSGHFRKAGIAIPQNILQEDLIRLSDQIQIYKPKKILIVGDLFHSHSNKEHDLFVRWRKDVEAIAIHLVLGNHDILNKKFYADNHVEVHQKTMQVDQFIFTHDINDLLLDETKFYFSGHIHPSFLMQGLGRQYIKLPCFYFTKNYAVLPAFGKFTGTYNVTATNAETIFAIVDKKIIKL